MDGQDIGRFVRCACVNEEHALWQPFARLCLVASTNIYTDLAHPRYVCDRLEHRQVYLRSYGTSDLRFVVLDYSLRCLNAHQDILAIVNVKVACVRSEQYACGVITRSEENNVILFVYQERVRYITEAYARLEPMLAGDYCIVKIAYTLHKLPHIINRCPDIYIVICESLRSP